MPVALGASERFHYRIHLVSRGSHGTDYCGLGFQMGFLIVTDTGEFWRRPSGGTTPHREEAHVYTEEEADRQRPMFKFWNSRAVPVEQDSE